MSAPSVGDSLGRDVSGSGAAWRAPLRGARLGLVAGLLLGLIEAPERAWALRAFLRGAGETAWLAGMILFFPMLVGALLGSIGGACAALAGISRRAIPLGPAAWRALWGAAAFAALTGWGVFALTLTVRFDGVIARWPALLALGLAAGTLSGLAWDRLAAVAGRCRRGSARLVLAPLVAGAMILAHLVNTYFAPQSSYGVHVLLLTTLAAGASLAAWLMPRGLLRRSGAAAAGLLVLIAIPADFAMRNRPRLEGLVKIRTASAARCVDLLAWMMDWDRDGWAPGFLVGGEDAAPLDPDRPPAILARAPGQAEPGGTPEWPPLPAARPETDAAAPGSTHILLLTLDACRPDVVPPGRESTSPLGALHPDTPALDSLAARSALFEAAYAPSAGTLDTFNSLFSGLLPPGLLLGPDPGRYLARRFERGGYAVRAWADDPHFAGSPWGFTVVDTIAREEAPRMMTKAAEFLGGLPAGRPGFAWIHLLDLHSEVLNPLSLDAYLRSRKVRAYARILGRVDSLVGTLVGALRREGLLDQTLIVVSADHGEEFGEHGHFHHNLSLYEPAIRVPLWLCGPGIEARSFGFTVSLEDLYPTLLEAARIVPGPTDGASLWPLLSGAAAPRTEHYAFLPHRGFSRRHAAWARPERGQAALIDSRAGRKVILRLRHETWEAYDLRRDPAERDNLAGAGLGWPDSMLARLRSEIARHAQTAGPGQSPGPPDGAGSTIR